MNNAVINTKKTETQGQFTIDYQNMGYGGCTPIINGEPAPMLTFGYVSESDYDACCSLVRKAVNACDGNVYKAAEYIRNAVLTDAAEIKADEAVMVEDTEMIIDYKAKKIYDGTEMIAEITEDEGINERAAVKALLIERAKVALMNNECDDEEYYEDDDEWDW